MKQPMTAADVRTWIAELREAGHNPRPRYWDTDKTIDFYRAVLTSVAENPINPSPTRATAEAALEL